MIERVIILPLEDNQGNSNLGAIQQIERELLGIVGGYSSTVQEGKWLDRGTGIVYFNTSLRITTTTDEQTDFFIQSRLVVWCTQLHQISLYTHTVAVQVKLIEPLTVQAVA